MCQGAKPEEVVAVARAEYTLHRGWESLTIPEVRDTRVCVRVAGHAGASRTTHATLGYLAARGVVGPPPRVPRQPLRRRCDACVGDVSTGAGWSLRHVCAHHTRRSVSNAGRFDPVHLELAHVGLWQPTDLTKQFASIK